MRKFKYVFLLAASVCLYIGCTKGTQTIGPAGKAGSAGSPGGGFTGTVNAEDGLFLNENSFNRGTSPNKYFLYQTITNPNLTYMLTVYVSNITSPKIWHKLPARDFFISGDQLYATLGYDSVKIYYNGSGLLADSGMNCNIIIVPQQ